MQQPRPASSPTLAVNLPSLMVSLVVRDAVAAAGFYQRAFGAVVEGRHPSPPGEPPGIRLAIGSARLLVVQADRAGGLLGPESFGGAPVSFTLLVDDPQATEANAVAHGAVALAGGLLRDPFLHLWRIAGRGQAGAGGRQTARAI